ncbi:MAG TPA: plasmid mobilization relaxosome protein MobC [Edaphobacter sp.]|nr:plasmid mobilization relaxosome protein MobC [Edaphobacter sp.]
MGRPSKHQIRDRQLNLKLTRHEFGLVCGRAAAARMRPVDFARMQLLAEPQIIVAGSAAGALLDPLFRAQLSRIGNNLNQIARRLHQLDIAAPPDMAAVLAALRDVLARAAQA